MEKLPSGCRSCQEAPQFRSQPRTLGRRTGVITGGGGRGDRARLCRVKPRRSLAGANGVKCLPVPAAPPSGRRTVRCRFR
eukprot:9275589-Pyramimonas_sp.AAC.1